MLFPDRMADVIYLSESEDGYISNRESGMDGINVEVIVPQYSAVGLLVIGSPMEPINPEIVTGRAILLYNGGDDDWHWYSIEEDGTKINF